MIKTAGTRYPCAPIAEAVLDVQVDELEPSALNGVSLYTDEAYPTREENVLSGAEIESSPLGMSTKSVHKMNGYRWTSEDGKQIVQMRSDGFTFSRLSPYDTWESFYAESRRLWLAYVELVGQVTLNRLALRYINQIQVPEGEVRIDEFLRTRPEISPDMPTSTSGYFLSLDIPMHSYGSIARIVETVLAGGDQGTGPCLVLDIDVYRPLDKVSFTSKSVMDDIDGMFGQLRNAKNLVFEASITDKSRRLFQ